MCRPALSIITVNLNDAAGLRRTAESVAAQNCHDFEWIVIDGASTDGSVDVIREYEHGISYWVSESDTGIYNAMNKGVRVAKGAYLQFLNAGDALADEEVVGDFVKTDPKADVIYGRARIIDSEGRDLWQWPLPEMPLRLSYFWNHSLKHQASFFSRRCFERFMYNEDNMIVSDTELFMQLLYHGYVFERYDRVVALFNGEGLSSRADVRARQDAEFEAAVARLMPEGMRLDYADVITQRDVDLAQISRKLIDGPRWLRQIARLVMYPFGALASRLSTK